MHQLLARLMAARTATHRQTPAPVVPPAVPPGAVVRECPDITSGPVAPARWATAVRHQGGTWDVQVHPAGEDLAVDAATTPVALDVPAQMLHARGWRLVGGWRHTGAGSWVACVERGW